MNKKQMLEGVKRAINRDGLLVYEWGRDKPLSDQLCWQGYTLATMCLLGEEELAKKLMKGLLWMEELTDKAGYLPRCVYYGEKEYDYIKRVHTLPRVSVGIWDNTSQDQYLGLFFGLCFAQQTKDRWLSCYARELVARVRRTLIRDDMNIKNEEGKICKFGKLNRFYQHTFFLDMRWTWRDKLMLKLMPLMKYQDVLKRVTGSRLNRSNYHMMLAGLYLICQYKPEFKRYYRAVYEHVANEDNAFFNAMYNKLIGKDKPVKSIVAKMPKPQYVGKLDMIERSYIVAIEKRPNSHWMWKEDPYMERYDGNMHYVNRYNTRADGLLALAIEGEK